MKRNYALTAALLSSAAAMGLGLTLLRLTAPVLAVPLAPVVKPAAAANTVADLLSGKTFPPTLTSDQIDPSYHLVALVDAQDKPSLYATKGETTAAGGETYLVCYEVTLTDPKAGVPPQIKSGTTAQIIFINLHAIQAMGGIIPIKPVETIAPAVP